MSIPENLAFLESTNLEAIARLVVLLEKTPDENFNIGSWTCGTVHCAAGLAACDPWFNAQGFRLDEDGDVVLKQPNINYGYSLHHWQAVTAIFNIGYQEAEWLFSGYEYLNEYPEPNDFTDEERAYLNRHEDHDTQNLTFRHVPKSAVIGRLKMVLELHKYELQNKLKENNT